MKLDAMEKGCSLVEQSEKKSKPWESLSMVGEVSRSPPALVLGKSSNDGKNR